jgi:predicted RNA-binding protein YlqC (UPF0109 family)
MSPRELVEYIARSLVSHPDAVVVREINGNDAVILELSVARDDKGRVIGRRGRVANAMRTLLSVAAGKQGKRILLEIV